MTKPDKQERAAHIPCETDSSKPTPPVDVEGLLGQVMLVVDSMYGNRSLRESKIRELLTAAFAEMEKRHAVELEERERAFHTRVFDYLGLSLEQRMYSWHEVEHALIAAHTQRRES